MHYIHSGRKCLYLALIAKYLHIPTKAHGGIWQLRRDTNISLQNVFSACTFVCGVGIVCMQAVGKNIQRTRMYSFLKFYSHAYSWEHICSDPVTHHNTKARAWERQWDSLEKPWGSVWAFISSLLHNNRQIHTRAHRELMVMGLLSCPEGLMAASVTTGSALKHTKGSSMTQ